MNFLLCDWRGFSTLPFLLLLALGSSTAQQPANTSSARTHNAGRDKDQTGERLSNLGIERRGLGENASGIWIGEHGAVVCIEADVALLADLNGIELGA